MSPDKKHILYINEYQKDGLGHISEINGIVITKISDRDISTYDLKNASWINDKQIVIPCNSIGGFAVISTDGNIEKIKNVEGVDKISIIKPTKVGDRIYYIRIYRGKRR